MTLDEFINKWKGKEADWDGAYAGQCVDLFRYYCHEVLNISQPDGVWGAANFWTEYDTDNVLKTNFDKIPNTADFKPEKGDVMIWNFNAGGGFGHVAICTGVNEGLSYFQSFDQNWSKISYCELVRHNYKNVFGVLRPKKGGNMSGELEACMADRKKFWEERDEARAELDTVNTQVAGYKSRITDLTNQLGTAQAEMKNREEQSSRLKNQVLDLEHELDIAADQLNSLQEEVDKFAKDKGALAIELEKAKIQIETLKQQSQDGEITLTFVELIKLFLDKKVTIRRNK